MTEELLLDDETQTTDINLDELLSGIKPNYVTPDLAKVTSATSKNRPKVIAELIIKAMANSLKDPVQKDIIHNGTVHTVRFVNVEPLCSGNWATISLMLLNLSYGEQSTLIEALYPDNLQLHAKTFAVIFTPELKQNTITIKQDDEIMHKLESANAGIAMILSIVKKSGIIPHADEVKKNGEAMEKLVQAMADRDEYQKSISRATDAAKSKDIGR